MLTAMQYWFLRKIAPIQPGSSQASGESSHRGLAKLELLLGHALLQQVQDREVVDFGCGEGFESVALAEAGASMVFGLDIRDSVLEKARHHAQQAGVSAKCRFGTRYDGQAALVITIDAFEHFSDPAEILRLMSALLEPHGEVIFSFGPTWLHPLGGHLFSVFPWAHLLFSEKALIRWRADFKSDGATRFCEVEGGLNQMTIARFERLVRESPFQLESLELVPIRKLEWAHSRLTREFTTAVVRGRLRRR